MTTMNYPANYTAIAADELVYLNGGTTLGDTLSDVIKGMKTAANWIGVVEYPVYTVRYAAETALYMIGETPIGGAADFGNAVTAFGQFFRYLGYTINNWASIPF